MKKEILVKKLNKSRQNSFWYKGLGDIAKFIKDDREIIVSVCGDIRVKLPNEDFYRKNQQAVDEALFLNLFDSDLNRLCFGECNWFCFSYKKSISNEWENAENDECFSYSDALKFAELYLKDDEFWEKF